MQALGHAEKVVRVRAENELMALGPGVVPALIEVLKDPAIVSIDTSQHRPVRAGVAEVLGALAPDSVAAVAALAERLEDGGETAYKALWALSELGPSAGAAAPKVLAVFTAGAPGLRPPAAAALGKLRHAAAVPELLRALGGADEDLLLALLVALGEIGQASADVVEAAQRALGDSRDSVRSCAAYALARLGRWDLARPVLEELLRGKDRARRFHTAFMLGDLGAEALPLIMIALKDEETVVQSNAARALGRIGVRTQQVKDLLASLLAGHVRHAAAEALTRVDPSIEAVIPKLDEWSRSTFSYLDKLDAIEALMRLTSGRERIIPILERLAQDEHVLVRARATSALAKAAPAKAKPGDPAVR